jgi:hypothetical protein
MIGKNNQQGKQQIKLFSGNEKIYAKILFGTDKFYKRIFKEVKAEFSELFNKFCSISPNNKELKAIKDDLYAFIGIQIYERINSDSFLKKNLEDFIIREKSRKQRGIAFKQYRYSVFEPIRDFFLFPNLILSSLEKSKKQFDIEVKRLKIKLSLKNINEYIPNKKYTPEMFEHTWNIYIGGEKKYIAAGITLEKFGFDWTKLESYLKRYSLYLKKRK